MKITKLSALLLALSLLLPVVAVSGVETEMPEANRSSSKPIAGDVNGDGAVDSLDVLELRRYFACFDYDTGASTVEIGAGADVTGDGEVTLEDLVALRRNVADKEYAEETVAPYEKTIELADTLVGNVNASYSHNRQHAHISNGHAVINYPLHASLGKGSITSPAGDVYVDSVSDAYIKTTSGSIFYASERAMKERMNIYRLGSYYYEVHMLDGGFVNYNVSKESAIDLNKYKNGNGLSNLTVSNGTVSFKIADKSDPYVHGSAFSYNTSEYDAVSITLSTTASTSARLYIVAGSKTGFNGEQSVPFTVTNDGHLHTYIVPLSQVTDYTGSLKNIRIDIGSKVGEEVVITSLKVVKLSEETPAVSIDKTYHLYSDKVNEVVRVVASASVTGLAAVGSVTRINTSTVEKLVVKDKNGLHTQLSAVDWSSAEYVGFDIKGAGVFGYILLPDESSGLLTVTLEDGYYKVNREYTLPEGTAVAQYGSVSTGHRIYTDTDHDFGRFILAAEEERHPLTAISVAKNSYGAKYLGYDALRGAYIFDVKGTNFQTAYDNPSLRYFVNATFGGAEKDREIYIVSHAAGGNLECGALMSGDGLMLPVDLEVCKNFKGENEEPLYDHGDTSYGEIIFPYVVEAERDNTFTVIHLYQNWGNFPLKQISSIQFIAPYYHLSVGTTETNCIAPYYVYGKDRWTLPDFRAMSAPLWPNQPQHTSIGRLYFLEYTDANGNFVASESIDNVIDSYGPTYCDIDMNYLSDDGKIKAYYRHMEMPHTDENRTYYEIVLEVTEDVTFNDFKNDFAFFSFDGRYYYFDKMGYLNENNQCVITDASASAEPRYITLGDNSPYVSFFDGPEYKTLRDYVNFGLVVKDYSFTVGGKSYDGNLVLRELKKDDLNRMSLTLDLGQVTLKAGDKLSINMILLPWGDPSAENDDNVRNVRADSCLDPYKVETNIGSVIEDTYMPKIMSLDGVADFTLSGGTNNCAVRVYGFDMITVPTVMELVDGEWVEYKLTSDKCEYDGYTVYYDGNGKYSYAFVVDMTNAGERRFKVTANEVFSPLGKGWQETGGLSYDFSDLPLNVYVTPENDEEVSGRFSSYGLTVEKSADLSYYRFTCTGESVEGYVYPVNNTIRFGTTGQYVVFKYRVPKELSGEFVHFDIFSSTQSNGAVGDGTDSLRLHRVTADGEWHVLAVDMSALDAFKPDEDGAYLANFLRIDIINGIKKLTPDHYMDIAYFGISDSLEDILTLNSDMDTVTLYSNGAYTNISTSQEN